MKSIAGARWLLARAFHPIFSHARGVVSVSSSLYSSSSSPASILARPPMKVISLLTKSSTSNALLPDRIARASLADSLDALTSRSESMTASDGARTVSTVWYHYHASKGEQRTYLARTVYSSFPHCRASAAGSPGCPSLQKVEISTGHLKAKSPMV